jgi:50S ribosomal protein L16 3-hydroxylase
LTTALDLEPGEFLREYWGRSPLLTRVSGDFANPLTPEELAGLAMEEDVESRLVRGSGTRLTMEHGPFAASSFQGDPPWTLLVQSVDHHVPAVAALRKLVDFLPGWQLDDVMVSYATDGGGVGPHFDNYDVFLLQGAGRRIWRLGQVCEDDEPQREVSGLRVLENFRQGTECLLEPGDVLYVPPKLAHWGIAQGDSMTYSIGFRAPRLNDMLSRWVDAVLPAVDPERLYRGATAAGAPGQLTMSDLAAAELQVTDLLAQMPAGVDWFGELVTEPGTAAPPTPDGPLPAAVSVHPAARVAWWDEAGTVVVFGNGERLVQTTRDRALLERVCDGLPTWVDRENRPILEALWELGCLQHA